MKFIWEPKDIEAGRRILSHNKSEEFIIGYDPALAATDKRLCLVSLSDGLIVEYHVSVAEMAERLNAGDNVPKDLW